MENALDLVRLELLKRVSPLAYEVEKEEQERIINGINLIPSENYPSLAVREASASIFAAKYAEGYPGRRYYPGCASADKLEKYAQDTLKRLFNAENYYVANVQPYSGSPANAAIYLGLLEPGDTLMGMALSSGGHLTHGSPVSFSGINYKAVSYDVNLKTGRLDYAKIRRLAKKVRPKIIVSGYTAYPRKVDFKKFHEIAKEVDAISMADISHIAGLIAVGLHPSPFPFTDVVMTTTHKTLRGPRGAVILCKQEFAKQIDKAIFPGLQGGPHLNTMLAKLVCFEEALTPEFKEYQRQIIANAKTLADCLMRYGFNLLTGGTDNHLMLIDLRSKGIVGKEAQERLERANIYVNKNTIPGDSKPANPSGLRLGTPAVTSRGMKEKEMKKIAEWINDVISDTGKIPLVKQEVIELCSRFPIP